MSSGENWHTRSGDVVERMVVLGRSPLASPVALRVFALSCKDLGCSEGSKRVNDLTDGRDGRSRSVVVAAMLCAIFATQQDLAGWTLEEG